MLNVCIYGYLTKFLTHNVGICGKIYRVIVIDNSYQTVVDFYFKANIKRKVTKGCIEESNRAENNEDKIANKADLKTSK